jgi:transcriptional regulator NrdR family protein
MNHPESSNRRLNIVVEEITSDYFVGAKIIREQKRTVSKETVSRRTMDKFPSLRRHSFNENRKFDIHQDELGNLEMGDYNEGLIIS